MPTPLRMSIAKKSGVDFLMQVGIFLISGIAGIVIARIYLPEGYGAFKLVLLANTLALNLTNLGLQIANTYFVGKDTSRLPQAHSVSISLLFLFTFVLFGLIMIGGDTVRRLFFKEIPSPYLLIAIGLLPFSLYYAVWTGILIGLGRIVLLALFNFIYQCLQNIAFIILLLLFRPPLIAIIIAWAVIQILAVLAMLYVLLRKLGGGIAPLNLSLMKNYVKFGFTAYFGNVASTLFTRVDTLIVSNLFGNAGVGLYSLAVTLAEKVWLIAASMEKASYSPIIGAKRDEALFLIQKVLRNTLFLSLLFAIFIFLVAPILIPLLYGQKFLDSIPILRILSLSAIFFAGSRILAIYFTGYKGKPIIPSTIAWFMFALNSGLCYELSRKYGLIGASASMAISYSIMFLTYVLLFIRDSGVKKLLSLFFVNRDDLKDYYRFLRRLLWQ